MYWLAIKTKCWWECQIFGELTQTSGNRQRNHSWSWERRECVWQISSRSRWDISVETADFDLMVTRWLEDDQSDAETSRKNQRISFIVHAFPFFRLPAPSAAPRFWRRVDRTEKDASRLVTLLWKVCVRVWIWVMSAPLIHSESFYHSELDSLITFGSD